MVLSDIMLKMVDKLGKDTGRAWIMHCLSKQKYAVDTQAPFSFYVDRMY